MTLTTTVAEGVLLFAAGVSGVIVNTNNTHTQRMTLTTTVAEGVCCCCRGEWCDC